MTKRGPIPGPVSVYALLDPETGRPRYVGHSKNVVERVAIHWGTRHYAYHLPVRAWLQTLAEPPSYVVLAADVPFERRFEVEATWTERLRAAGEDLLNVSVGAKISPEHAQRTNAIRRRYLAAKRLRERGSRPAQPPRPQPSAEELRQRRVETSRRRRERKRLASDAAVAATGVPAPATPTGRTPRAVIAAQTNAVAQLLTALGSTKPVRASVAKWLGVSHTTAVRRLHDARRLLAERAATVELEEATP